jgi:hypothetical protein
MVPSVIVPEEWVSLINPKHSEASRITAKLGAYSNMIACSDPDHFVAPRRNGNAVLEGPPSTADAWCFGNASAFPVCQAEKSLVIMGRADLALGRYVRRMDLVAAFAQADFAHVTSIRFISFSLNTGLRFRETH